MSTEIEYFAFVSDKNIVENVIVCNSREDFQALMRFIPSMGAGTWIPATEDTGRPSKGNNYHPNHNRFYPSRMYESWTFDEELWKWVPPIPKPPYETADGTPDGPLVKQYLWNEAMYQADNTTGWIELTGPNCEECEQPDDNPNS